MTEIIRNLLDESNSDDFNSDYPTSKHECHDYDFYDADDVLFTYEECLNLIQYSKNHWQQPRESILAPVFLHPRRFCTEFEMLVKSF